MKLRYWFTLIVIVLFIAFLMSQRYLEMDTYTKVDMVELNDWCGEVKQRLNEELEENADDILEGNMKECQSVIEQLEEQYACKIYFYGQEDYETNIHNAIQEQEILMDYVLDGKIIAKIVFDGQAAKLELLYQAMRKHLIVLFLVLFIILLCSTGIIYLQYIRPFKHLQRFTTHIAKGDLDFPLAMTKGNYFGVFTESFDIMREELKRARQGEYEANMSKKELVASLSHDIKTPVATIKAICEILMLKIKDEATMEKIVVINQKAGMIDTLISDMFHAALEELMALKIAPQEELSTIIKPMFDEINYYGKIRYTNEVTECLVIADALRLNQVIDNVVNNSYKYADTDIWVSFYDRGKSVEIVIKDEGSGVGEEELLLLTEKFYRGSNASGQNGSGLGLYLSKVFMEGMGGKFSCENDNGFVVRLTLAKSN